MEESLEWWKKAQWGRNHGHLYEGSALGLLMSNMSHLYYVKDGLDIGRQRIHAHGAAWPLVANPPEWTWTE